MNEPIEKGKKARRQLKELRRLHQDGNHPAAADANSLADGICAGMHQATPDETKGAAEMAALGGNPVSGYPDGSNRQVNSRELAHKHPDLRQSSVDFSQVLARLSTRRGNVVDLNLSPDTPGGFSHAGSVVLADADFASQAGSMNGVHGEDVLSQVNHNPYRPDSHQHRDSATAPNGTHSLTNPESHAVANKASDRLRIMKAALFGGD